MIEGGGHSHESSRTASALSHICNRVCRKIIRMPAYLSPHKRPKKRRDEKSGSAQQGEKLGCGHHHAETHQSPIETSSISPSYTYALCCCSEDGKFQPSRWTIRLEKVDSCEKVSLKIDVFLLHFFVFKEEREGMDVVVGVRLKYGHNGHTDTNGHISITTVSVFQLLILRRVKWGS